MIYMALGYIQECAMHPIKSVAIPIGMSLCNLFMERRKPVQEKPNANKENELISCVERWCVAHKLIRNAIPINM